MNEADVEAMKKAFNEWCPYRGNPDPNTVWQAAWVAAMNYFKTKSNSSTEAFWYED